MGDKQLQINLSIFKDINQHSQSSVATTSCSEKHGNCIAIKRLLTSLSYYNLLDINNNTNDQLIFNNFIETVYTYSVYDDFYHLTKYHGNEMELIMDSAIKSHKLSSCDLSVCLYSDRHYRINKEDEPKFHTDDMKYFYIYREMMDSLHFYVFHLITSGLRMSVKTDLNENDQDNDNEEKETESLPYFDGSFSRISNVINHGRQKTDRFARLSGNKFNISAVHDADNNQSININVDNGDDTFLDEIYKHLLSISSENNNNKNDNSMISKLMNLIELDEYETDSIDIDLSIFKEDGICNISLKLNDDTIVTEMIRQFNKSKSYNYILVSALK